MEKMTRSQQRVFWKEKKTKKKKTPLVKSYFKVADFSSSVPRV